MLLCQISDLHVMPKGRLAYDRVDTAALLRRAIAQLNRLDPQPDMVLITGDLADRGEPEAYAHLREILADLRAPFLVIRGNHDHIDAFRSASIDRFWLAIDAQDPSFDRGRHRSELLRLGALQVLPFGKAPP